MRYVYPLPIEEDFLVAYPAGPDDPRPLLMSAALIADCKKNAFTGRQRDIRKQRENEKMIWGFLRQRMSPASQSKVKEEQTSIGIVLWCGTILDALT